MRKFITAFLLLISAGSAWAATQKFFGGTLNSGLGWVTVCNNTDLSGLAAGNAIQCLNATPTGIDNSATLDLFADFSMSVNITAATTTAAGAPYIGVSIYPLNQDGTTYGDGAFASTAAGPPKVVTCAIPVLPNTAAASGPFVGTGSCRQQILPPGKFLIVAFNGSGQNLATTSLIKFRTYNYQSN